ncbi:hypothetical protein ACOI1D_21215, partial [Virgibacillus sp. DJP39]
MFITNDLICIEDANGDKQTERILWIDEGSVICYTINIEQSKAFPVKRKMSDLMQLYEEKLISLINKDPFSFIYQSEEELSDYNKSLRDERWRCIKSMVLQEPEIFSSKGRGSFIQVAMKETGKTKRLLYKYMMQ